MSLEDALKIIRKDVKSALEFDEDIEGITTGSIAVDKIVGNGGFPRRRISEVFGWESSGKTTLCLSSCANAQRKGLYAAYIDPERGVNLYHAEKIGFNFKDETKGLYATPFSFQDTIKIINALAESGECDLIVVDSVPAMVPEEELKGAIDGTVAIGLRSRLLSAFLARITKTIDTTNTALVLVNQMRARISTDRFDRGPKEQAAGGSALKFYSSLRVDMENVKQIREKRKSPFTGKDEEVPIGNLHRAKAFKNKVSIPYRRCEFYIMYDENGKIYGVDNLQTVIDMAKAAGIIMTKGGGYFSFRGDTPEQNFEIRGTSDLYDRLFKQPELVASIRKSLGI